MALVVQKYGGTSVANPDRIKNVARRVAEYRQRGDRIVVVVSAMSGVTDGLIKLARQISENPDEREMDVLLDASVRAEADPYNLAPTASTAVATALGDALALAVRQARNLTPEHFAQLHPAGQLGRNLRVTVRQVMHGGDAVAWAGVDSSIRSVIIAMNRCSLGAACGQVGEVATVRPGPRVLAANLRLIRQGCWRGPFFRRART